MVPTVHAQVALGLKTGALFNTVRVTDGLDALAPDFSYAAGFTVGGVAEINIGQYFAVQPEFNYAQKGFRRQESEGVNIGNMEVPIGATATFRTHYLELPVLAKLKIGNETVKAYFAAGPSVGYAADAQLITRPRLFFEFDPIRTDINLGNLGYERWEFSGVGAAGVQFNLNGVQWYLEGRYVHGFTELYDFPLINEKILNRGVSFTTGVMLPLQ